LVGFLKWALTDGQKMAPEMTYATLAEPFHPDLSVRVELAQLFDDFLVAP
jgi:hypothetical protein